MEYMAFISYRHADNNEEDRQWATWLHHTLEVYDIPEDLIGTINQRGEVIPERIYPVFRDEVSLPASADIRTAINEAIDQSRFMIVLCSPRAVSSPYVTAEITRFKSLGKSDQLMAAILLGEPNASSNSNLIEDPEDARTLECFPIPLRFDVDEHENVINNVPTEPLAVDFRLPDGSKGVTNPGIYSRHLINHNVSRKIAEKAAKEYEYKLNNSKLKLIAGIIGVPLELLTERDKEYRLRRAEKEKRNAKRIVFLFSILLISSIFAWIVVLFKNHEADIAKSNALEREMIAIRESRTAKRAQTIYLKEKTMNISDPWIQARVILRGIPREHDLSDRPLVGEAFNSLISLLNDNDVIFPTFPTTAQELLFLGDNQPLDSVTVSSDKNLQLNKYSDKATIIPSNNVESLNNDGSLRDESCKYSGDFSVFVCLEFIDGMNSTVLTKYSRETGSIISSTIFPDFASLESIDHQGKIILVKLLKLNSNPLLFTNPFSGFFPDAGKNIGPIIVWDSVEKTILPLSLPLPTKPFKTNNDFFPDDMLGPMLNIRLTGSGKRIIALYGDYFWVIDTQDGNVIFRNNSNYNYMTDEILINDDGNQIIYITNSNDSYSNRKNTRTTSHDYDISVVNIESGNIISTIQVNRIRSIRGNNTDITPMGWITPNNKRRFAVWPNYAGSKILVNTSKGLIEYLPITGISNSITNQPPWLKIKSINYSNDDKFLNILGDNGISHIFMTDTFDHIVSMTLWGDISPLDILVLPRTREERKKLFGSSLVRTSYIDKESNLRLVSNTGLTIKRPITPYTALHSKSSNITLPIENTKKLLAQNPDAFAISSDNRTILSLSETSDSKYAANLRKLTTLDISYTDTPVQWYSDIDFISYSDDLNRLYIEHGPSFSLTAEIIDLEDSEILRTIELRPVPDPLKQSISSTSLSNSGTMLSYCRYLPKLHESQLIVEYLTSDKKNTEHYGPRSTRIANTRCLASGWLDSDSQIALIIWSDNFVDLVVLDTHTMEINKRIPLLKLDGMQHAKFLAQSPNGRFLPIWISQDNVILLVDLKTGLNRIYPTSLSPIIATWDDHSQYLLLNDIFERYTELYDIYQGRNIWRESHSFDRVIPNKNELWIENDESIFHTPLPLIINNHEHSTFSDPLNVPFFRIEPSSKRFVVAEKQLNQNEVELRLMPQPWETGHSILIPSTAKIFGESVDDSNFTYVDHNNIIIKRLHENQSSKIALPSEGDFNITSQTKILVGKSGRLLIVYNENQMYICDTSHNNTMTKILEGKQIFSAFPTGEKHVTALFKTIGAKSKNSILEIVDIVFNEDGRYKTSELKLSIQADDIQWITMYPAPDGNLIMTGKRNSEFSIYRFTESDNLTLLYTGTFSSQPKITQSDTLRLIAVNTTDGVLIFDLVENRIRHILPHKDSKIVHAFSSKDRYLFTGSPLEGIRQFDTETGAIIGTLYNPGPLVLSLMADNSDQTIAAFFAPHNLVYLPIYENQIASTIADIRMRVPKSIPDKYLSDVHISDSSTEPSNTGTCNQQALLDITKRVSLGEQQFNTYLTSIYSAEKTNNTLYINTLSNAVSNIAYAARKADTSNCHAEIVDFLVQRQSRLASGLNVYDSAKIWFEIDQEFNKKRVRL